MKFIATTPKEKELLSIVQSMSAKLLEASEYISFLQTESNRYPEAIEDFKTASEYAIYLEQFNGK